MSDADEIEKAAKDFVHDWPTGQLYHRNDMPTFFVAGVAWRDAHPSAEVEGLVQRGLDLIRELKDQNNILPGEIDDFEEALKKYRATKSGG